MIRDYARLIRPLNCTMGAFGTVIAVFVSGGSSISSYASGAVTAFLAMAAGNALNDYTDIEIDRTAHPQRPLPSGRMSKNEALYLAMVLFLLACLASLPLGVYPFAIVLVNISLMILYELYAKNNPSGNIIISYLVGSLFLFGGAIAGHMKSSFVLFLLAFFATLGREIAKGIEDVEGDRGKRRTIAVIDLSAARYLSAVFIIMAVILSPLPYLQGLFSAVYLPLVALADILFIYSVTRIGKNSVILRYSMLIALLAFIGGAI
ncbi:MAG: UbiA family prenyltransferase [Candidatus Thermoplasmatota archaeon]|nr:UbiA family prenyltransferase [Candidatus Thermoplasmatota archaeon]